MKRGIAAAAVAAALILTGCGQASDEEEGDEGTSIVEEEGSDEGEDEGEEEGSDEGESEDE